MIHLISFWGASYLFWGAYLRPFTFIWMPVLYLFGRCSIFSESVYLFGSFLALLSFSLIYFYWWFFASASETNRYSLTEFLLQQGQGRVCTGGEDGGIVNCREKNKNKANEITTLLQRLKNTGWSCDTEGWGEYGTKWMKWGKYSWIMLQMGECGSGSRVTIRGKPGILVNWCWNTGCWNERVRWEVHRMGNGWWDGLAPNVWHS